MDSLTGSFLVDLAGRDGRTPLWHMTHKQHPAALNAHSSINCGWIAPSIPLLPRFWWRPNWRHQSALRRRLRCEAKGRDRWLYATDRESFINRDACANGDEMHIKRSCVTASCWDVAALRGLAFWLLVLETSAAETSVFSPIWWHYVNFTCEAQRDKSSTSSSIDP